MILGDTSDLKPLRWKSLFEFEYQNLYGFTMHEHDIIIADIRVRGIATRERIHSKTIPQRTEDSAPPQPFMHHRVYFQNGWIEQTPCYQLKDLVLLGSGTCVSGPALIIDQTSTLVLEFESTLTITATGDIRIKVWSFDMIFI
jgi:5-oxoprolinase (ATP-hydrolysing)